MNRFFKIDFCFVFELTLNLIKNLFREGLLLFIFQKFLVYILLTTRDFLNNTILIIFHLWTQFSILPFLSISSLPY